MPSVNDSRGSIWRKWDLHIHTPGGKVANGYEAANTDEAWNKFIDALEASDVQAFGITDYFGCAVYFETLERYKIRYPNSSKILFPNIELRLAEAIGKNATHPNLHIIFDNDPAVCGQDKLVRLCTDLRTQAENGSSVRQRCCDLDTAAKLEAATVSLDDVQAALKEGFGETKPYLLAVPANNDGIRSTDSSPRNIQISDRLDKTSDVFFGNAGNRSYFLRPNRYQTGASEAKPVVSGCDAHSFPDLDRLSGDVAGFPSTWIKADLTFRGLQQICFEPEDRIFIGDEPEVQRRQVEDGTKFIQTLKINQIDDYDERNGRWFKDVEIPLNPELTAIIGNKGSGKSAIVDVVGLLGESRQEQYFSFLTDDPKNKKFRQSGYAENFQAEITWLPGSTNLKNLNDRTDSTASETIRYLPQNYFEQLTNEIEIEKFRSEIEDVVFSHVEESDRLGKTNFSELEDYKTLQSKQEISSLKKRLRELNIEIVKLEEQSDPQYKKQLEGKLKTKREEIEALDKAKPKEIPKPDAQTPEQKELSEKLNKQTSLLSRLADKGKQVSDLIAKSKEDLQAVVALQEQLVSFQAQMEQAVAELSTPLSSIGLDVKNIIKLEIKLPPITAKLNETKAKLDGLEKNTAPTFTVDTDYEAISTLPDLRQAYTHISKEIEQLKEQLSTPSRQYQGYVERLDSWQKRRDEITGTDIDPKPDTLRGIEVQMRYLDEALPAALGEKREQRIELAKCIYRSKQKVLQFYTDLKVSVDERLCAVRTDGFSVEIGASFVIDPEFRRKFLDLIDQRKKGVFRNNDDATKLLGERIASTNWDDIDSVVSFAGGLLEAMQSNNGLHLLVKDQAHDVKELYDFLFSFDYFDAKYELRLSGKNLNELSPGEKGLLLLVFYLQLDKKNTPLVIDQPEDNLDNDSIFQVLAKCIREAKKARQVILVTHNPNLAVGADAEQVIYVKLDKTANYQFSWESGAIENPLINKRIVDVLEGSQPAFVKRRLKYGIT